METILVRIKSGQSASLLADFLKTIEYVEAVTNVSDDSPVPQAAVVSGIFKTSEKPSDFAGIWKNRKKIDAKKLRKRAWQRKKQSSATPIF